MGGWPARLLGSCLCGESIPKHKLLRQNSSQLTRRAPLSTSPKFIEMVSSPPFHHVQRNQNKPWPPVLEMTKNPQLRRVVIALIVSVTLNGILLILDSFTGSKPGSLSLPVRIVEIFFSPSGALTEWLVPAGHDASHILGAILVSIVSSIIFHAGLAWIILATWARARRAD